MLQKAGNLNISSSAEVRSGVTPARSVERVIASQPASAGSLPVRRALPTAGQRSVGPWVFLDHFGPATVRDGEDGVGPHPHAGIETVTYLLDGRNEHRDSAGHRGIVEAGGAQWMTAGRGVIHAERPLGRDGGQATVHGIQLWTSLPRSMKLMPPAYRRLEASAITETRLPGAVLRVVAGDVAGTRGPAEPLMPLFLAHLALEPGASARLAVAPCFEAGAFVIAGEARVGGEAQAVRSGDLAVFGMGGDLAIANESDAPAELMLLGGEAAEGPLVFHGPFVMNSLDQVRAAEVAYRTGRMGQLD